ncbi:ribosome biogenesis protein BMS1 homolog [Papaver somniferum]|uniref:ribosome biogenesis protein BMS1 homolog n=1 Tax=Papaver somniferum TaxID=3469 RepID=UPI000E6FCF98|nr:ribosome biogenesis protein BMS1 homolog [Papaver somniferum]
MPITSSGSTSQIYRPAFEIYRDNKPNKCEDQDWDGGIGSYQPLLHDDDDPAPPPYIVVVQGPPNVGKSLLIKSLVKHYTEQHMIDDIQGPITIRTGQKRRRLQFVECPDDINGMMDAAKYADIVLLLVDASYGFEAETFEFLSLLRVHGLPKVMGVLTHLDHFKDDRELTETLQRLQGHFQTEICEGETTFHLSGLNDFELYRTLEVQKLAEAISMLRLHTPSWRAEHPYVLVDRFEDVTPPEKLHKDANCKRNISLYGYLRGCNLKRGGKVHLAGVGDFRLYAVRSTADPVPLSSEIETENGFFEPAHKKKKRLKTGTYLRWEVHNVPFGMVKIFDPCHPILVGGMSHEEENVGYMQARLKRHDWHMKLLKSDDPVTVSAGWRRYQTIPIFAMHLDSKQHESAKYIPQYGHCLAMFWGTPCTSQYQNCCCAGKRFG